MLPQQRSRAADDAAFYQAIASNPFLLVLSIVFTIFQIYCIYRCVRNEAWLWLILGLCLCQVFLWIGAFGSSGTSHGGQRRRKGKTVWHRY